MEYTWNTRKDVSCILLRKQTDKQAHNNPTSCEQQLGTIDNGKNNKDDELYVCTLF